MEGWCDGGMGWVGSGACSAGVLLAAPFLYNSHEGGGRWSVRGRSGTPDSDFAMPPRHRRARGGCASPCPQIAYPTRRSAQIPQRTRAGQRNGSARCLKQRIHRRGEQCPRWSSSTAVTHRSHIWIERDVGFFRSAFPDCGGWLLLPDQVARARARKVADVIDSVMWCGATWSILIRNI